MKLAKSFCLIVGVGLLGLSSAHASIGVTTLYSFPDNSTPHGLIQGQDGNLYGTTDAYFYRLTLSGGFMSLHTYGADTVEGSGPHRVIQGSDGNFYGTMSSGGSSAVGDYSGDGTVFQITPGGTLTTIHNFNNSTNGDGSEPAAGLIQAKDGYFYGITYFGGTNPDSSPRTGTVSGTVFKISSTGGVFSSLHTFYGYSSDGSNPDAPLIQAANLSLYGTTYTGGINSAYGTVFSITTSGSESVVNDFSGSYGSAGSWANPAGPVMQASDGNFYGTTPFGPTTPGGEGTVYRVTPGGQLTVIHSFTEAEGINPTAGLVQTADGNFYGVTPYGGAFNVGTVFKMTSGGTITDVYSFTGGNDGGNPQSLILASDGYLYTTTTSGGGYGLGAVVRINIALPQLYFQNGTSLGILSTNSSFLPSAWQGVGGMSSGWQARAVGDINGDGLPDIIFQKGTSLGALILNSSGLPVSWVGIGAMNAGWQLCGAADITGDGNLDLIFQNGTLLGYLEVNNSGQPVSWTGIGAMGAGWQLRAVASLDGTGQPDLIFQNGTSLGALQVNASGAPTAWTGIGAMGTGWTLSAAVDLNGDDQPDLIFQNGSLLGALQVNTSLQPVAWHGIGAMGSGWTLPGDY